MDFVKKNRRTILIVILYFGLLMLGMQIYKILNDGINPQKNLYIQLSSLISFSFLVLGCFWELYFAKKKESKKNSSKGGLPPFLMTISLTFLKKQNFLILVSSLYRRKLISSK
ncbi:hypothetical protein EV145_112112 [Flavobacterium sp. 245]|nr:hypothetical protein EV145_112112 [Flavobacterium sp. 245]